MGTAYCLHVNGVRARMAGRMQVMDTVDTESAWGVPRPCICSAGWGMEPMAAVGRKCLSGLAGVLVCFLCCMVFLRWHSERSDACSLLLSMHTCCMPTVHACCRAEASSLDNKTATHQLSQVHGAHFGD